VPPGRRGIRLPETLKHERQEIRANTDACVLDHNLNVRIYPLQDDLDASARGCELDRVGQEVPQNLLQTARITSNQPNARIQQCVDAQFPGIRGSTHCLDGIVNDFVQADELHFEMNLPGDDPAHIEQITDDLRLGAHVALDSLEPARTIIGRDFALPQQSSPPLDGIQRGAQLVRECCQKLIFHMAETFSLRARVALRLQELLALHDHLFELGLTAPQGVFGGPARIQLPLQILKQPRLVDRDRGLRRNTGHQPLRALRENILPRMSEEQSADDIPRTGHNRDREITAHRQVSRRHSRVGRVLTITRIELDVARPNDARSVEGRSEHLGGPRHRKLGEGFAWRT